MAEKVEGDVHYFLLSEEKRLLMKIRKGVDANRVPDTQVTFNLSEGRPPLPHNPTTKALGERELAMNARIGSDLALAEAGCGTDAGYAFQPDSLTKPAILESLGIVGGHYLSPDEFAVLATITPRLYLAPRLVIEVS